MQLVTKLFHLRRPTGKGIRNAPEPHGCGSFLSLGVFKGAGQHLVFIFSSANLCFHASQKFGIAAVLTLSLEPDEAMKDVRSTGVYGPHLAVYEV
jgi:hypothetical protein